MHKGEALANDLLEVLEGDRSLRLLLLNRIEHIANPLVFRLDPPLPADLSKGLMEGSAKLLQLVIRLSHQMPEQLTRVLESLKQGSPSSPLPYLRVHPIVVAWKLRLGRELRVDVRVPLAARGIRARSLVRTFPERKPLLLLAHSR